MAKLSIFLTGSNGFIGRNILEQLKEKYIWFTPSHKELDVTDFFSVSQFFKTHSIDIVLHCANIGGSRKNIYIPDAVEQNLRMFLNLAYHQNKFQKMIHFGSGTEYDRSRPIREASEEDFGESIPKDQYGFCKYTCSLIAKNIDKITVLRLFGVFGKYEDYTIRFISNNIVRVLFGLPIVANQNVYFDYLYIDDLVRIIDHFICNKKTTYSVYNIGRGEKIDLLTLATYIQKVRRTSSKILVKKIGLNNEFTCNNKRLLHELKDFSFTRFDDAISHLYSYYQQILPTIQKKTIE